MGRITIFFATVLALMGLVGSRALATECEDGATSTTALGAMANGKAVVLRGECLPGGAFRLGLGWQEQDGRLMLCSSPDGMIETLDPELIKTALRPVPASQKEKLKKRKVKSQYDELNES